MGTRSYCIGLMCCRTMSEMLQSPMFLILLNLVICGNTQETGRLMLSVHPTNGFVKEGETLKFQCGPKKTKGVSWYKNGQYFSSTQTNVYQTLATSETGGSYHCEVYFPPQKSEPVEVVITDKNVAFHVVPISPLEGETLKLSCRFKFNIPLKKDFVFYRNGKEIHSMKLTNRESSHSIKVNSTDGSGWYKCTIGMFESRSVKVQVQVRARSYSTEIAASLVPVLLFAGLIASAWFIHRRGHTGNSSPVSQPKRSQASGEAAAASNLEYAVIGAAHNAGCFA
ncbi:low affinity immunoglobulin gamma Fc region receptor III-like [Stegostoma tigrinum]|uniref:low affinity immunoglobulin gamma Fc region receptor III-like n=1 Tax=Stegostoma tigrinum TaxID=3053191 RepID=UPI00286FBDFF|nr:low affinity immunoglobulin gamma Fc region receptor III-like [Stegostoma tigrinum]